MGWVSDILGTVKNTFRIKLATITAAGLSAARTYTLQNRSGTLADDTDLALKAPLADPQFTGSIKLGSGSGSSSGLLFGGASYIGAGYAAVWPTSVSSPDGTNYTWLISENFVELGAGTSVTMLVGGVPKIAATSTGATVSGDLAVSGAVSGSNLSGTNTGDQTISLTGDVTGSGTGSFAATIAARAVTFAKTVSIATSSFLGRTTAGAGDIEVLSVSSAKTLLALVKGDVGLGNVDNTSDANKPVSTAQQTALDLKENLSNIVTSLSGSSTNTQYPSAKLTYDQLALKAALAGSTSQDFSTALLHVNGKIVDIDVTPSAWEIASGNGILQFGTLGALAAIFSGASVTLMRNAYFDGTDYRYIATGAATQLIFGSDGSGGTFVFKRAVSGSAGAVITWVDVLRADGSGNIGVGMSPDGTNKLDVGGPIGITKEWGSVGSTNVIGSFTSYGDANRYTFYHAAGTIASPTATQSGQLIFNLQARGYNATNGFSTSADANISFLAAGSFTSTSRPTRVSIGTTPVGSTGAIGRVEVDSEGNFFTIYGVASQGRTRIVATAAGSTTIAAGNEILDLQPAATIASYTVTMRPSPIDGQRQIIATSKTITTFTLNANSGQTIQNAPTTLAAGTSCEYFYDLANTVWVRLR